MKTPVLVAVCGVAGLLALTAVSDPYNVLLILSDDLTAETLSCFGNTQCRTPNIDRLAARGTRFVRAYCQYPVCGPSRASLMSGMYAQSVGVTGNGASTRFTRNMVGRPSLAEHFRDQGWFTARVSKIYHMRVPGDITAGVDGPDHAASWTERYNCRGAEWMSEGRHAHLSNEKLRKDPDKHYGLGFGTAFYTVAVPGDGAEQPDAQAADKALELMKTHRDEPFFLAVGLVRPHVPLVAPEVFFDAYEPDTLQRMLTREGDWEDIPAPGISGYNSRSRGLADPDRQRRVLQAYYASVSFMDAQVGRLLDGLEQQGLADRTVVVFSSDHGYHLGEHDFWQKMSLHEESARVPLIMAVPGQDPAVCNSLVELIDLFPTLSELAGLPVPGHCQGKSLAPVIVDSTVRVRDAAYTLRSGAHLLRTARWAYMRYPNGDEELYDMEKDPKQFTNLAAAPEQAELLRNLRKQLAEKRASMQTP